MALIVARTVGEAERAVEIGLQIQLHAERLGRQAIMAAIRKVLAGIADHIERTGSSAGLEEIAAVHVEAVVRPELVRLVRTTMELVVDAHEEFVQRARATEELTQRWLATAGGRKIGNVSEELRRDIIAAVRELEAEGLGAREIARRLRSRVDLPPIGRLRPAVRAEFIARTEIHHGAQWARYEYLKREVSPATLQRMRKTWAAVLDRRVRVVHAAAHGQEREFDAPFEVGGEPLLYPGDAGGSAWNVINCRCQFVTHLLPLPKAPKVADVSTVRVSGRPKRGPISAAKRAEEQRRKLLERYPPPPEVDVTKPDEALSAIERYLRDVLEVPTMTAPSQRIDAPIQFYYSMPERKKVKFVERLIHVVNSYREIVIAYPNLDVKPSFITRVIMSSDATAAVTRRGELLIGRPLVNMKASELRSQIEIDHEDLGQRFVVTPIFERPIADVPDDELMRKYVRVVITHELGHILDESAGNASFKYFLVRDEIRQQIVREIERFVSRYATTNVSELFAEMVAAATMPRNRRRMLSHPVLRRWYKELIAPLLGEPDPRHHLLGIELDGDP